MPLSDQVIRRIVEVAYSTNLGFVELVGIAELNPATSFRDSAIKNVDMSDQNLAGFDFTGCNFVDLDLRGADLSQTVGVTPEMLECAIIDERTRLPPPREAFWSDGQAPAWAYDWGTDVYGKWVSIRVPLPSRGEYDPPEYAVQRMRWIPPGRFCMGSPGDGDPTEQPLHSVTISDGFWMFDTACTQVFAYAVMRHWSPTELEALDTFPIVGITWTQAQEFIRSLNGLLPDLRATLPSEAHWEYACRAGSSTPYNVSIRSTLLSSQVHYDAKGVVRVGSLPPNAWGLYEMHGNVNEWCEDRWHDSYDFAPNDGSPWIDGDNEERIVRGGCWISPFAGNLRSASRHSLRPSFRGTGVGFRCQRERQPAGGSVAEPTPW
jgi:Sulfatase-modifying factor enzyme 1/Pentapeptide repeats (8 copies)